MESNLVFNRAQRNFIFNLPLMKDGKLIWGRATGKSSIIAWIMRMILKTMPRSCWVLQGATYQQILTKTLPGTLAALEKLGFVKDRDYFINRFPPAGFYLPYQAPAKADNCLFLVDHQTKCSVAFTLFSQDRSSSRGPNRDGCICDESLLLDIDKFNTETKPTIRGNREYFGKNNLHHGVFHFTSMPHGESFLFDGSEDYAANGDNVLELRDKLADMQLEFIKLKNTNEMRELWAEIHEVDKKINFYPIKNRYYSEYNAFDNIKALGLNYIKDQLKDSTELLFQIEILNKRSFKIEGGFYAYLSRQHHTYKGSYDYSHIDNLDFNLEKLSSMNSLQDKDCIKDLPLYLGMDFGTAINWLIVGQSLKSINQFNFIKNFIVKSPKIIDDLIQDFCNYYEHHTNKTVYLHADAEGNNPRPNVVGQTTYIEQVVKLLRKNGWVVNNKSKNRTNPEHQFKYMLWARCLNPANEHKSKYPVIRFNAINCKELLLSMERSPTKDTNNKIGKDKGSEKKLKTNREQATDGGDAADQIIYGEFYYLLKEYNTIKLGIQT